MAFAALAGYEPVPLEAVQEALFTDPLDNSCIPQLSLQKKKRFPSLAALRANAASGASLHAVCADTVVRVHNGCRNEPFCGPSNHKDELATVSTASALKKGVPLVPTQLTHLAGAAVLGLRKHSRGASESSTHLQKMHAIPRLMMQAEPDAVPSVKISSAIKAPMAPRPPSAAPRPRATGNGKRPMPCNMHVLTVPGTC